MGGEKIQRAAIAWSLGRFSFSDNEGICGSMTAFQFPPYWVDRFAFPFVSLLFSEKSKCISVTTSGLPIERLKPLPKVVFFETISGHEKPPPRLCQSEVVIKALE